MKDNTNNQKMTWRKSDDSQRGRRRRAMGDTAVKDCPWRDILNNGKLNTKWISGMVIIKNGKVSTHTEITSEYYLVDMPAKDRKEGYPLSSIMVHKKTNKYDIYLKEEDKKNNQTDDSGYINFIKETI